MVTVNNPTGTVMAIPESEPEYRDCARRAAICPRLGRCGRCVIIDVPFYPAPDAYRRRSFFSPGRGKLAANGERSRKMSAPRIPHVLATLITHTSPLHGDSTPSSLPSYRN